MLFLLAQVLTQCVTLPNFLPQWVQTCFPAVRGSCVAELLNMLNTVSENEAIMGMSLQPRL